MLFYKKNNIKIRLTTSFKLKYKPQKSSICDFWGFLHFKSNIRDFLLLRKRGKNHDANQRRTTRYSSQNALSGLLVCAECGANYRRITRPSGEVIWRCANKVEHGKKICKSAPSISEDTIKENLRTTLNMAKFDEEAIRSSIVRILIQHNSSFEIEYKHEMRHNLEY